ITAKAHASGFTANAVAHGVAQTAFGEGIGGFANGQGFNAVVNFGEVRASAHAAGSAVANAAASGIVQDATGTGFFTIPDVARSSRLVDRFTQTESALAPLVPIGLAAANDVVNSDEIVAHATADALHSDGKSAQAVAQAFGVHQMVQLNEFEWQAADYVANS